jgi:Trypsin-like peptidase domain
MPTPPADMADLYRKFHVCMVRVTTEAPDGTPGCGAAFHIGDGWLATARHVIDHGELKELAQHGYPTGLDRIIGELKELPQYRHPTGLECDRIIYPADEDVDLALLHTSFDLTHYMTKHTIAGYEEEWKADHIQIGGHLDDWISDDWMMLTEVLLMGYPPIPFAKRRDLVAMRGEVNAVIDMYRGPRHPHFIISPLPRGGFSGGPVLTSYGALLGVMTESLILDDAPAELGYGAAITVEPLWDLLGTNNIYPASNADFLRELENPGG